MRKTFVFDLDDTLVPEIAYLKSAFREIAATADVGNTLLFEQMLQKYYDKQDAFGYVCAQFPALDKATLQQMYRNHNPDFSAYANTKTLLESFKAAGHFLGLVTDGFSITQRNKIKALGIEELFDKIVVSEEFGSTKPDVRNFEVFHEFGTNAYYYISDNVKKDFIGPNSLGWTTICLLDAGENIHQQDFNVDSIYLPAHQIKSLAELQNWIAPSQT